MDLIDKNWIKNLANLTLGKPPRQEFLRHNNIKITNDYLDNLCLLIKDFVNYYNYLLHNEDSSKCCRILTLTPPRKGLVIAKNTEKFILSLENSAICIRILEANLNFEKTYEHINIKPNTTEFGNVEWFYEMHDGEIHYVNTGIIIKKFLSNFLIKGKNVTFNH